MPFTSVQGFVVGVWVGVAPHLRLILEGFPQTAVAWLFVSYFFSFAISLGKANIVRAQFGFVALGALGMLLGLVHAEVVVR